MTDATAALPPLDDLLDVLTLKDVGTARISVTDPLGRDAATSIGAESARVFLGRSQRMPHGRVFGGQVLAQCVMAAGLTVGGDIPRPIHSLHGYFMRPGDDTRSIHFAVEEMRDGRSFSTRRVHAIQKGAPIMSMSCSFQVRAEGVEHQEPMPAVAGPEGLPSLRDLARDEGDHAARRVAEIRPIEQRQVEDSLFAGPGAAHEAASHVWLRSVGRLPSDPLLHAAVLAYASDYSLLDPVLRAHGLVWGDPHLRIASLDHAMWFHRPADPSDWILYSLQSPSAESGRGLAVGQMFTQDGTLVATTAQEGMVRVKES